MITKIVKRDGRSADFNLDKITHAIYKAANALGGRNADMARELAEQVEREVEAVSYTHLDVYKRQASDTSRRESLTR